MVTAALSVINGQWRFQPSVWSIVLHCSWRGWGLLLLSKPVGKKFGEGYRSWATKEYFLERSKTTHMKRLRFWRIEIANENVVDLFDILDQIGRRC